LCIFTAILYGLERIVDFNYHENGTLARIVLLLWQLQPWFIPPPLHTFQ
jgi:hypothetical protein